MRITKFINKTKYLLIPFYIILMAALAIFVYFDIQAFIHYITVLNTVDKKMAMLVFIELIDITMVANLGKMIITGSYNSFVEKSQDPLEAVSAGKLKVKMATSLVGITSISILEESIRLSELDWDVLHKLAYIHIVFLVSALVLAVIDYLYVKAH